MTWTYLQQAKQRHETTNNKQIFRLFYNMGQSVLFSNMFSTQHLVAVIRALLHGGSWWKQSVKHLLSCVKRQLLFVFFTGYKILFFLSEFRVSRERERLFFSLLSTTATRFANHLVFSVCIYRKGLMMNEDFASGSRNLTISFYQFVIFKLLSYCFEETIRFDVKASFASHPVSRIVRWYNKPGDMKKGFEDLAVPRDYSWIEYYKPLLSKPL